MIGNHSRSRKRSAFTLVELMVVILIIAILVSLLAAGVMKVMGKIPEVTTRTEITELEVGLRGFMSDYNLNEPPPSYLVLNEVAPSTGPSATFLQKVFGKNLGSQGGVDWNGDGTIAGTWLLEGEQCLVFYLGGIPNQPGVAGFNPQGFSTNNMKPSYGSMPLLGETLGKRKGPYFNFQIPRLASMLVVNPPSVVPNGGPLSPYHPVYIDAWQVKISTNGVGPRPYAYFSSNGIQNNGYLMNNAPAGTPLDCFYISALPYFITGATPTQFTNPNQYQIISAGRDGVFGTIGWIPAAGATGPGADDQANFSSSLLGSGQS